MKVALPRLVLILLLLSVSQLIMACTTCNKPLQEAIFDNSFFSYLLQLIVPLPASVLVVGMVTRPGGGAGSKMGPPRVGELGTGTGAHYTERPLVAAAAVLGIGMGGFVDGIVFHQILQWHQMLSNQVAPVTLFAKNLNMFWDGIFHAFTWVVTLTGIVMLWRLGGRTDVPRSGWIFAGGMLAGFAAFNIVEGIADHYLLKLHNVREITDDPMLYNHVFMGISVVLLVSACLMVNRGRRLLLSRAASK